MVVAAAMRCLKRCAPCFWIGRREFPRSNGASKITQGMRIYPRFACCFHRNHCFTHIITQISRFPICEGSDDGEQSASAAKTGAGAKGGGAGGKGGGAGGKGGGAGAKGGGVSDVASLTSALKSASLSGKKCKK